jgi:DNA invertase Pin-like site-specific DNA recombinase
MAKAIAYLRVSGQGQIDGDGFARQREAITRFAKAGRYTVVEEYRDEGVSGTRELENRPGLAAILDRVESNGVHVVLIERADRLARDLMVSEVILQKFRDAGARVLTADGQELTADDDPTRRLIRQVLAAVAEYDKTVTVLKLRAARQRIRAREGRCEGRKPFGERPGEHQALELMKQLRRKTPKQPRRSYAEIANELNARQVPTRTGAPWQARTVYGILTRGARRGPNGE